MLSKGDFTREIISKLTDEQKVYLLELTQTVFPASRNNPTYIKIYGHIILRCIYGYPGKYGTIPDRLTPNDHLFMKHNLTESLN